MLYTVFMTSKSINLTRKVVEPLEGMPPTKGWKPNTESKTYTMPFGNQMPIVDVQSKK